MLPFRSLPEALSELGPEGRALLSASAPLQRAGGVLEPAGVGISNGSGQKREIRARLFLDTQLRVLSLPDAERAKAIGGLNRWSKSKRFMTAAEGRGSVTYISDQGAGPWLSF
jgi:hypothetical protein